MRSRVLNVFIILFYTGYSMGQSYDVDYLNPQLGTDGIYKFMCFGNIDNHYAGLMWNESNSYYGDGDDFSIFTYDNRDLTFRTGTGNVIIFPNSGGNVGIGTKTPDSKLTVNGTIHTKEIKVDLNGWSDFVFEKDYDLPTLEMVEKYILEKGHLKGIPSSKEVQDNGIYLGEMDARLLQKIEELTLYVIQQNKMIKALESILNKCDDE